MAPRTPRTRLAWLTLAVLLHGVVVLLLQPRWAGEDEPWHVEYALAEAAPERPATAAELARLTPSQAALHARTGADPERIVANQRALLDSMRRSGFWQRVDFAGWEFGATSLDHVVHGHTETVQPPLYYRAAGALLRALDLHEPDAALDALRVVSLLVHLAVVLLAHALARRALADGNAVLLATLLCAWLPLHARQAGLVSNDVLARLLCALALLLAADAGAAWRPGRAVGALLASGLALATKASAVGAALAAVLVVGSARERRAAGRRRGLSAAVAGVALLAAAALYWHLAGHDGALPGLAEFRRGLGFVTSTGFWSELSRTLPGTYRWEGAALSPWTRGLLAGALLCGLGSCALRAGRVGARPTVLVLCWLALGLQLAAMVLRGYAAARYLLPVLPALAVLVGGGWTALVPERRRRALVLALVVALVALDGVALWSGLLRHEILEVGS